MFSSKKQTVGTTSTNSNRSLESNGSKGSRLLDKNASQSLVSPLLATEEATQPPVRRRRSSTSESIQNFDEKYDEKKAFYGSLTLIFFVSAIFAHFSDVYSHHAEGAPPVGKILSAYVLFIPLAWVLQKTAALQLSHVLIGGLVVGILWTEVEENGGNVTLTVDSMLNDWQWYHFLVFGALFVAVGWGLKYRIEELKRNDHNMKDWSATRDVYWSIGGVVLAIIATIAGAKVHVHHWFVGFALCLACASLRELPGFIAKAFFFGLFLHGAAVWGLGDVFQSEIVTTTTVPTLSDEAVDFVPLLFLGAAAAGFFGAKHKGFF